MGRAHNLIAETPGTVTKLLSPGTEIGALVTLKMCARSLPLPEGYFLSKLTMRQQRERFCDTGTSTVPMRAGYVAAVLCQAAPLRQGALALWVVEFLGGSMGVL